MSKTDPDGHDELQAFPRESRLRHRRSHGTECRFAFPCLPALTCGSPDVSRRVKSNTSYFPTHRPPWQMAPPFSRLRSPKFRSALSQPSANPFANSADPALETGPEYNHVSPAASTTKAPVQAPGIARRGSASPLYSPDHLSSSDSQTDPFKI